MKRILLVAVLLSAVVFAFGVGNVTAAQATPNNSRSNAVRMAKDYLEYKAFSLKGLVSQLKYEGFSTRDATYGASHSDANWMKQAVRMAKDYLRYKPFSRKGLVEQLEYEGFTHSQALHGARGAGL